MRTKYHNRKTRLDGTLFDSKHEAERYWELKMLQKAGEISGLTTQMKFTLIPSQYIGKKLVERPVTYIADFVYRDKDGNLVVEDAKSEATRTAAYILKRKLMLYLNKIRVIEV